MKREVLLPFSKEVAIDSEPEELTPSFLKFRLDTHLRPAPPKCEGFFLLALVFTKLRVFQHHCAVYDGQ